MRTSKKRQNALFALLTAVTVCVGVLIPRASFAAPTADPAVSQEQAHWSASHESSDHAASSSLTDSALELDAEPDCPGFTLIHPGPHPQFVATSTTSPASPPPVITFRFGPAIYQIAPSHSPPA